MIKDETSSTQTPLRLGQLVVSLAGRDKGNYYLVCNFDGHFYFLTDGVHRGVNNPKKKNRRHLQHVGRVAADFADMLANGKIPRNEEIRRILEELVNNLAG